MRSTASVLGWEQKCLRPIPENLNWLDLPLNNALHGSIIIIKSGMVGGGDCLGAMSLIGSSLSPFVSSLSNCQLLQ